MLEEEEERSVKQVKSHKETQILMFITRRSNECKRDLRHSDGERQSTGTPWWQQRCAYAATLVQKHSQSPPRLQEQVSARQFM